MAMTEFNLVHEAVVESDINLFFGPIDPKDVFIKFTDKWKMADILVTVGIFPSRTQARKNGFTSDIAPGFSMVKVGKEKHTIHILNTG